MSSPTSNLFFQDALAQEDIEFRRQQQSSGSRNGLSRDESRPQMLSGPASSSGASSSSSNISPRKPATRSQKAVAACTGAIATSLTMTPFDVIKTRLQTQSSAEPLFRPSSHLPPLKASSQATTSRVKLPPASKAHAATCCQPTFFTGNAREDSLTCKFDPRSEQNNVTPAQASSRTAPSRYQMAPQPPRFASVAGAPPFAHTTAYSSNPAALLQAHGHPSSTCAYPDPRSAALELDAVTRSQRLTGMWDGVVKVSRAEGVKGLWRGLSPTLLMAIPSQVTYMTCYDHFRAFFLALEGPTAPSSNPIGANITAHTLMASLASGALSRSVSATLVTPLELVRTRLQASDVSHSLRSIISSLSTQVRSQGPTVLFRGLSSTLWRDVPFSAIYFMGYETMKRYMTGGSGLGEGEAKGGLEEFGVAFVAGATSGSVAALATHPFDLLKTRLQAESGDQQQSRSNRGSGDSRRIAKPTSSRTIGALKTIVAEEGMVGLFRGLTPRVAKVAPACGLMIGSYEAVGTLFSRMGAEENSADVVSVD